MPRRDSRGHRLPTGGYREHRLAIWGVTGCVAVAAGVALTAGLAAASPQLGNIPGSTDRRPALAGLPTTHPSADPGAQPMAQTPTARAPRRAAEPSAALTPDPSADPAADARPSNPPSPSSSPSRLRSTPFRHR